MTAYHTASGSVYEVNKLNGKEYIRRRRLGEGHIGDARNFRVEHDKIDGTWREATVIVGVRLSIVFADEPHNPLITGPIERVLSVDGD